MKITDEKISELAEKYAKDNFNNSPTAYYAFKEGMKQAINYTHCCTELNNSLKECDDVWFNYEKHKIIGIDYKNKVASIKSVDGLKFIYNLPLDQLTKIV